MLHKAPLIDENGIFIGNDYFERLNAIHIQRHHVKMLERLGLKVSLEPLDNVA